MILTGLLGCSESQIRKSNPNLDVVSRISLDEPSDIVELNITCDIVLDKCKKAVDAQKRAIKEQQDVIKKQDEIIEHAEKEVSRAHKATNTAIVSGTSTSLLLLLLLLL